MSTAIINAGLSTWDAMAAAAHKRNGGYKAPGADDASMAGEFDGCAGKGTKDLPAAIKLLEMGWPEGTQAIAKALDSLPAGEEVLPDWQLDVAGAFPCVPAFLSGEPECVWHRQDNRRIERRVLIAPPGSYPAMVSHEAAMVYAKAVAAVVRAVEASGIEPGVFSIIKNGPSFGSDSFEMVLHAIQVRTFGEPLDLAKVAFAYHPAMLRRIDFAWREVTPEVAPLIGCGAYGSVKEFNADEVRQVLGSVADGCPIACLPPLRNMEQELTESNLPNVIAKFRTIIETAINGA